MIELSYSNGEVLLFDVNDWTTLRKTHRIVGSFAGNTNILQTLPLRLLPEEVLLLIDEQVVKVVDKAVEVTPHDQDRYKKFANDVLEEEKIVYKSMRRRQLEVMIDDIVAAKRKRGDVRASEEIFNEELEKSTQINEQNMIWPTFLQSFSSSQSTHVPRDEILKRTTDLRYRIFKDLWHKGYYITSGFKFGADFLVYLGDPISYHAIFIVHCVENSEMAIHSSEIVAFGRLATSVKKRAVLASMKDNQISYITINWIDA